MNDLFNSITLYQLKLYIELYISYFKFHGSKPDTLTNFPSKKYLFIASTPPGILNEFFSIL